jgi:hypothetical protein
MTTIKYWLGQLLRRRMFIVHVLIDGNMNGRKKLVRADWR